MHAAVGTLRDEWHVRSGSKVSPWRRAWRDKILPALARFEPDLIFISAGFDAHRKDVLNHRYIGLHERDYEWVTREIMKVCTLLQNSNMHWGNDAG